MWCTCILTQLSSRLSQNHQHTCWLSQSATTPWICLLFFIWPIPSWCGSVRHGFPTPFLSCCLEHPSHQRFSFRYLYLLCSEQPLGNWWYSRTSHNRYPFVTAKNYRLWEVIGFESCHICDSSHVTLSTPASLCTPRTRDNWVILLG